MRRISVCKIRLLVLPVRVEVVLAALLAPAYYRIMTPQFELDLYSRYSRRRRAWHRTLSHW
jgi:hypothetical protein